MRLEMDNLEEADERRECIELLKAMLQWDGNERITPAGILNHPFITKSYLNSSSHLSSCSDPEPSSSSQTRTNQTTQVDDSSDESLPPGVIMVRPAAPMNRIPLEETPKEDAEMSSHVAATPASALNTRIDPDNAELPTTTPDDSEDQKKKREKRKNCFKRFFSWMKRTFCSCCYADNVVE
ncbi:homeodomain-interacting protein kinase 2-like [Xiphias gladius]|uniref:homeodomain-interacting protein kinase 2-like n=1 Tax=Xiphias gladius TaxID=8245 RepID=UPI001A987518|nr:homeodomain-interacting protein kinase 2-like [Xiphias gladius]